jgi:hypothetical protein
MNFTIDSDIADNTINTIISGLYENSIVTLLNAKQPIINTYTITGGTGGSLSFASGVFTLATPTTYSTLTISSLTTDTSFIYKGTELSTTLDNYLLKTGGAMTGQITGVTTLNGTTGILATLATTNNIANTGLPGTGVNGAVNGGDKIILYPGGVGVHPYSIGIAPNNLWYSATNGASHNFYIGGNNALSLSSTLMTITTDLRINKTNNYIQFGNTNGNNIAIPDTANFFSTSAIAGDMVIRSIKNLHLLSGSGNSAITIKETTNNVGIGTNNPNNDYKLHIRGANPTLLRIETSTNALNEVSGIEFGIQGYTSTSSAKILSTTVAGFTPNLQFITASGEGSSSVKMTINGNGNVAIGTINNISSKLTINDIVVDRWSYDHSTSPLTVTNQTPTGTTLNDPQPILNLCRQGVNAVAYGARATFKLCRYENVDINSKTRMDISLAHTNYQTETNVMTLRSDGNVGINVLNPSQIFQVGNAGRLRISNGTTDFSILGSIDSDGPLNTRIVVSGNTRSAPYAGCIEYLATGTGAHIFYTTNSTTERMRIASNGVVTVNGLANIHNGYPSAVINNYMTSGSLTIGGSTFDYGNAIGWSTNTAGLMMECLNYTEICVHDAGTRVASLMHYDGVNNKIFIGRNKGWTETQTQIVGNLTLPADKWVYSSDGPRQRIYFGTNSQTYYQGYGNTDSYSINHEFRNNNGTRIMHLDFGGNMILRGYLNCLFLTVSNTGRDLTGIKVEDTITGALNYTNLYCIQGTFTGFHRVYTEDENFNIEDPQKFKNDYEGRIVVSTGKIATDTTDDNDNKENTEWRILQDKEGIAIEDALPKIELSRKRKDKRVFGVLGDKRRTNNRAERLIVNSVGEGAIWVCNSNGNIENGDYITSSDYLGYGEKQDEIFLCNYTVAKATMDCDFQLDSPLYQCIEIQEGLRIAFIAATYHCG